MKQFYILLITLFMVNGASGQSCLSEGISFTTQAQIDNFQTNYPGCTEIEGNVMIKGENINDLNGLGVLTSIGGNLDISWSSSLITLTGLGNLTSIGGKLSLYANNALTSLAGLGNLASIGGDLSLDNQNALTGLTGLENLSSIGGSLYVGSNPVLTSLTGLNNLTSIGANLEISGNGSLINMTGLENLTSIGNNLNIRNNPSLISLTGLDNINPGSIIELSITFNSSLSTCNVQSICTYLTNPNGAINIYGNSAGCNNAPEIANACGIPFSCLPHGNYCFLTQSDIDNFPSIYPNCTEIEGDANIGIYGSNIFNLNGLSGLTSIGGNLSITNTVLNNLAGLENLSLVEGDLTIGKYYGGWFYGGNPSLTSLTGLENLETVGGGIFIEDNDNLAGLTGMDGLTSINNLQIIENDTLTNFAGFENLQSIAGNLNIYLNRNLINLAGPGHLTSIGGDLVVQSNNLLANLTGLDSLTCVNGNLLIGPDPFVGGGSTLGHWGNPSLTNLGGLLNLSFVGGYFYINENNSLANLSGLDNLSSIGGDLFIGNNAVMTSLNGLENLDSLDGMLFIYDNSALTSLSGLDNLNAGSVTGLKITYNPSLANCHVQGICDYLASPGGTVDIYENAPGCNNPPEVASSCGFSMPCLPYGNYLFFSQDEIDHFQENYTGCTELQGTVYINGNDIFNLNGLSVISSIGGNFVIGDIIGTGNSFTNLIGLDNIVHVGGSLSLAKNNLLNSMTGLGSLTTIGNDLYISNNPSLTSLEGINALTSIGKDLYVAVNPLTSLTGLDNLDSIGGNLEIVNNTTLSTVEALGNLNSVAGGIEINHNTSLVSLAGLDHINAGSITRLRIGGNHVLSNCEVQSICDYLASPGCDVIISGNSPGCNSQAEVEAACAAISVGEITNDNAFSIYPNPSSTEITIESPAKGQLSILNLSGKQLLQQEITEPKTQLDISTLPSGVYFVRVTGERTVQVGKFVKN